MTHSAYTERANVEGEEAFIGRDPRKMTVAELASAGHLPRPLIKVIRQNCIGCCAGSEAEVRRCRMIQCPMWPYRMGKNPFHTRALTDDARKALAARMMVSKRRRSESGRAGEEAGVAGEEGSRRSDDGGQGNGRGGR